MRKQEWCQLYESMQRDIGHCIQKQLDNETEIECCFQISRRYWAIIENKLENYCFQSGGEETAFYKNVKPLFVSSIEYYNLLYHAALFKPAGKPEELKEFWIREGLCLDKFICDHRDFHEYYKSADSSRDESYFLSGEVLVNKERPVYCDEWIAMLLALEKYAEFVKQELNVLSTI